MIAFKGYTLRDVNGKYIDRSIASPQICVLHYTVSNQLRMCSVIETGGVNFSYYFIGM